MADIPPKYCKCGCGKEIPSKLQFAPECSMRRRRNSIEKYQKSLTSKQNKENRKRCRKYNRELRNDVEIQNAIIKSQKIMSDLGLTPEGNTTRCENIVNGTHIPIPDESKKEFIDLSGIEEKSNFKKAFAYQ